MTGSAGSKVVPARICLFALKPIVPGDSPTTVNACITFLREVFKIGMRYGVIFANPAQDLKRKPLRKRLLRLPNGSQFAAIVAQVRSQSRWGGRNTDLIEGLAYSGMRIGEARCFIWPLVDFEKNCITILGDKTANAPRTIPMIPALRDLLERMRARSSTAPHGRVFETNSALGSLPTACEIVGIPHLTHHDLRHLFTTTCLESGVDVSTVALWLGHADGGALALRTYGHVRPEHSSLAAARVRYLQPGHINRLRSSFGSVGRIVAKIVSPSEINV